VFEVELVRGAIAMPSVRWVRNLGGENEVGYLFVSDFQDHTMREFDQAMAKLLAAGARALILDLRWNRGGLLEAAIELVNRFLERGVIVSLRGRGAGASGVHHAEAAKARYANLPLVVLVNGESASASEVVAGAIQDHRLGVVAGSRTWGKGVVQTVRRLPEFDVRLKLTTAYYFTPLGRNIEGHLGTERGAETGGGIEPDLAVPAPAEVLRQIHRHLQAVDPPAEHRQQVAALIAAAKLDRPLAPLPPERDPQLAAALDLLQGKRTDAKLPAGKR
jgi:carboxyl-terminal processing protease